MNSRILIFALSLLICFSCFTPPSFACLPSNPKKVVRSEVKTIISSINRGQQAYFVENNHFASSIDNLGLGLNLNTTLGNYQYNIEIENNKAYASAHYIGKDLPCFTKCRVGIEMFQLFGILWMIFDHCNSNPRICWSWIVRYNCAYYVVGMVYQKEEQDYTATIVCKSNTEKRPSFDYKNGEYVCSKDSETI